MLVKVGPLGVWCRKSLCYSRGILSRSGCACTALSRQHLSSAASSGPGAVRLKSMTILEHSAVLLQDGLEIKELPWVIRRLTPRELPFAINVAYSGDNQLPTAQEDEFMKRLSECTSVHQVMKLLEVPGERVTASSAAFALQRICHLRSVSMSDNMETFIRKAVMHELCETVTDGLTQLNNATVISLAGCAAMSSSNYEYHFVDSINNEVERRIGDAVFSVTDLCSLIRVLSVGARGDVFVTENVWIHLGSRYREIDASNIAEVYRVMRYIIPKARYLWRVVERQLQSCWWKLSGDDVVSIAARVAVAGRQSSATLTSLGRWLHANVAVATDTELRSILAAHADFDVAVGDGSFASALERYVVARIETMDRTAVAMATDFFRRRRWLSTRVLDAVARDFQQNGANCTPHEILYTLRPFGQLNYLPPNSAEFFDSVETILSCRFAEFDSAAILEVLASFVNLERFPVNFAGHIFTPHFLAQVRGIRDAAVRQRAGRHLLQIQAALLLEAPQKKLSNLVDVELLKLSLNWQEGRSFKLHQAVAVLFRQLLGAKNFVDMYIPWHTPHAIDFVVFTDGLKNPVDASVVRDKQQTLNKLAVLTMMPEYFCVNTRHLLGEYATKQRHLKKLGFTVIEVDYEQFMWKCQSSGSKFQYIKSLLSPYVALPESELLTNSSVESERSPTNDGTNSSSTV